MFSYWFLKRVAVFVKAIFIYNPSDSDQFCLRIRRLIIAISKPSKRRCGIVDDFSRFLRPIVIGYCEEEGDAEVLPAAGPEFLRAINSEREEIFNFQNSEVRKPASHF